MLGASAELARDQLLRDMKRMETRCDELSKKMESLCKLVEVLHEMNAERVCEKADALLETFTDQQPLAEIQTSLEVPVVNSAKTDEDLTEVVSSRRFVLSGDILSATFCGNEVVVAYVSDE